MAKTGYVREFLGLQDSIYSLLQKVQKASEPHPASYEVDTNFVPGRKVART